MYDKRFEAILEAEDITRNESELLGMVYGDFDTFDVVVDEHVTGTSRWSNHWSAVVKHAPSDTYFEFNWEVGATEYQDNDLNLTVHEVWPYEETVTKYRSQPF